MIQPTLIECWNFEPQIYRYLVKFRDDLTSRYPNVTITNLNSQALAQRNYSDTDKLVLLFTNQPMLNDTATKALSFHDKSRTRVICYPAGINTGGIPAAIATTREELVREMVKVMGNSVTYHSTTPSALGSLSKIPLDQREQAKPLGLYVFRSKNKEFNHRMNEIFYNFKESPIVEFNEVKRLLMMQDRPNKLQMLIVSSSDIDVVYQDLELLRQSDSQRLTTVLFNTAPEIDDHRHQYDLVTTDKNIIEDRLRAMVESIQEAGGRPSMMLAPIQEYNGSIRSSRAFLSNGALMPQSVMSRSLSPPGMRSSNRLGTRTASILSNPGEPQVYVMDFQDTGYKQFYTMLPVNYNVVPQIPPALGNQKNYLIVPAERSAEVLSTFPLNQPNLKVIIYGNPNIVQPHPAVELVSSDMDYIKRYLASNQVRIVNQPVGGIRTSTMMGGTSLMASRSGVSPTQFIQSTIGSPRLSMTPKSGIRRDLTGFYNASIQQMRTSHMNRAPYFGVPSNTYIPYANQSTTSLAPAFNTSGQLTRLHSATPTRNTMQIDFNTSSERPRSVIPGRVGVAESDIPLPGPPPVGPLPNPQPNPVQPTTITTTTGGTTKTITTYIKPGKNRVVEEVVTTTTVEPRVIEVPVVTKIINETIQIEPPKSPKEKSRIRITEIPYPVVERNVININSEYPVTREIIAQTENITIPAITTTVKTKYSETINEHTQLGIDSTLGKNISKGSRTIYIRAPTLAIPEEVVYLENSMRRSRSRTSRVVREEIRVHPPDASAAIVQEIRYVLPSVDLLSPAGRSRTILAGKLRESTLNILNNSQAAGNSRVHYRLYTNTEPVTTYVKEYVETNVEPSTLVDHVIDHRVKVVDPAHSISSVRVTETVPSRIHESHYNRVIHRVSYSQPVFDHVRVVYPTVKEYTRHIESTRHAEVKHLSPNTDLKDLEFQRMENGIPVYIRRADRSFSNGKTVEKTYSTVDYSPRQYIDPHVRSMDGSTPVRIDSYTTINRQVRNGVSLEYISQMIDKRYHGDPIEITTHAPVEQVYSATYNTSRVSNHINYDRQVNGGSIYYTTNGHKEYVVVPQSGRVRELSEGYRRIRKRSGSLRGSRLQSGRYGTLYLIPDSRKYLAEDLYKFVGPKDKVQPYYLNEDLKFARYSDYGTVFVFPIDETHTNLPAVFEQPNAYIVKQSRPADGAKELRVNRLEELLAISKELKGRGVRYAPRYDVQMIFKKLNPTIDQVRDHFRHYNVHEFFSTPELDNIITQMDPQKIVVMVVDQVPDNIERFRNFSLFSCVVIPQGSHYKAQKARYPKLKWIHDDDIDLICDDIKQEIKRLSSKYGLQKSYSSLKGSAPRLISYYEDTEVQEHALSRLQNRMIFSQYHDHSSLTKRIFEATGNRKVIVLNPQFARYAGEIDAMAKGDALIIIYDKQSRTPREYTNNPKVRVARNLSELIDELEIYLQYGY